MSTRCQIAFYDDVKEKDLNNFKALIYRHSDGYPEEPGTLPDLLSFFIKWKDTGRLNDMEYTSARCLQFLTNLYDKQTKEDIKGNLFKKMYPGQIISVGYGISNQFHCDIEFLYAIYSDRIDVYEVGGEDKDINKRVTKLTDKDYTIKF